MPSSLLDSQFTALEPPSADEDAWVCDISQPPDVIVARLVERSRAR
jgi:gluconokinase